MKGVSDMKAKWIIVSLCLMLVFCTGMQVSAKSYYKKGYNPKNNTIPVPYEGSSQSPNVNMRVSGSDIKTLSKDLDNDGKAEKIELSLKNPKGKITVKINNKTVIQDKKAGEEYSFDIYDINGKTIAVLTARQDEWTGNITIGSWSGGKFKILKKGLGTSHKRIGSAYVARAKDKKSKQDTIYVKQGCIYDAYEGKWPKNILKKYKKFSKRTDVVVKQDKYDKYTFNGKKLISRGSDTYYYVAMNCY